MAAHRTETATERAWRALGAAGPRGPGCVDGSKRTASLLLSREVTVLNNAIAFNFLLCLFPLLLVLVAAAQRLAPGSGGAATRCASCWAS